MDWTRNTERPVLHVAAGRSSKRGLNDENWIDRFALSGGDFIRVIEGINVLSGHGRSTAFERRLDDGSSTKS